MSSDCGWIWQVRIFFAPTGCASDAQWQFSPWLLQRAMLKLEVVLHRGEIDARMRMKVHVEMTQGFCFERPELIQKQKEIVQRVLRLAAHVEGDAPLHERAYSILILCRRDHELIAHWLSSSRTDLGPSACVAFKKALKLRTMSYVTLGLAW